MNSQSLFIIEAKKQGYSQLKTSLFFFPQIKKSHSSRKARQQLFFPQLFLKHSFQQEPCFITDFK